MSYSNALSLTGRQICHKVLPPKAFDIARFCWWCASFYLPRTLARPFAKRQAPEVEGFGIRLDLVHAIRRVNAFAPNRMCCVMNWYGSDKGCRWHNYTTVYSTLLSKRKAEPLRIFELGLGTDDPTVASTMGTDGRPGASLRGWRHIFPHALVFGADIDLTCLFEENRIQTFYCDQLDQSAIQNLWAQPQLRSAVDLLIEDGLHTFDANVSFLRGSLDHLRPGGIYAIEDIRHSDIPMWRSELDKISKQHPTCEFALVRLPHWVNSYDNNMLIIKSNPTA